MTILLVPHFIVVSFPYVLARNQLPNQCYYYYCWACTSPPPPPQCSCSAIFLNLPVVGLSNKRLSWHYEFILASHCCISMAQYTHHWPSASRALAYRLCSTYSRLLFTGLCTCTGCGLSESVLFKLHALHDTLYMSFKRLFITIVFQWR